MERPDTPRPRSTDVWTGYLFHWVHRQLQRVYAESIRDLHLSTQQIAVMQLLQDEGPITQARIAELLRFDKGAVSLELANLEAQGLAKRTRLMHDRRKTTVELLDNGRSRLAEIEARNAAATRRMFRGLSTEEVQLLHDLLKRVAETAEVPVS